MIFEKEVVYVLRSDREGYWVEKASGVAYEFRQIHKLDIKNIKIVRIFDKKEGIELDRLYTRLKKDIPDLEIIVLEIMLYPKLNFNDD